MSEIVKKSFEKAQSKVRQREQQLQEELKERIEAIKKKTLQEIRKIVS